MVHPVYKGALDDTVWMLWMSVIHDTAKSLYLTSAGGTM